MFYTISLSAIGFTIGAYFIYTALLFLLQKKLIFQKVKPDSLSYKRLKPLAVNVTANDGTVLHGWRIENHKHKKEHNTTLIYFGGNAQDVIGMLPILEQLEINRAYTFNYRGYGLSEGEPSEKSLYSDSIEIVDQIRRKNENSKIVLMGHSLGSAIAGYAASLSLPSKLILLCPIHSITEIAINRYYAPSFLIKHKFSLVDTAKKITTPTLILLAEKDSIIPTSHSTATLNNLANNTELKKIPNCDHNDLFQNEETLKTINNFIVSGI